MDLEKPIKGLLIGAGRAGVRFGRALHYLYESSASIRLAAVVDHASERLRPFAERGIPGFTSLEAAFASDEFDLVLLCANERAHFPIFRNLQLHPNSWGRIISEKPLSETLHEADQILDWFEHHQVFLNFVERYSPVSSRLKNWISERGLHVQRANFSWGKYRINDARPTMGVLSELSHPLDLICWFADLPNELECKVNSAHMTSSNYSPHAKSLLDSVFVSLSIEEGPLITGASSFVWGMRDRRVQLFLGRPGERTEYMASLIYDAPRWDNDELTIYDVTRGGGVPKIIDHMLVDDSIFDPRIRSIEKIRQLIQRTVTVIRAGGVDDTLADLGQSMRVQRLLHATLDACEKYTVTAPAFAAREGLAKHICSEEDRLLHEYLIHVTPKDEQWEL